MSRSSTAEEVRQEHVNVLGEELGSLYHRLWSECAWIHMKWEEYRRLYGTSPDRLKLLNSAAGGFFRMIQDVLWEDTLLHLARLVDRTSVAGKNNVTIQGLPDLVADELKDELDESVGDAVDSAAFAIDWRNRHIAHRDLQLALVEGAKPLTPASRRDVTSALSAVAEALNKIAQYYFDTTVMYGTVLGPMTGAEKLLYVLRDGVETEAARRTRMKEGKLSPEDLEPPRPL